MSVPSTPTQVSGLSEKHVVDIACGKYHCLALTSDGKVSKRLNDRNDNNNNHFYKLNVCNLGIWLGKK